MNKIVCKIEIYQPPHAPQFCVELNGSVIYRGRYDRCMEYANHHALLLNIEAEYEESPDPEINIAIARHIEFNKILRKASS